jgi:hypothetical protein
MAPILVRAPRLQRRAEISATGYILIITLVSLVVTGLFCGAIFFFVCKKQREREKRQRRMQEERRPFVAPLAGTYSGQQIGYAQTGYPQSAPMPYVANGPIELQGPMNPGKVPPQQLDGYAVGVCRSLVVPKRECSIRSAC